MPFSRQRFPRSARWTEGRAAGAAFSGGAAFNAHRVLESLFHRPIASVGEVQVLTDISFAATNQLVVRMTDLRILREITGYSRNRRFRYERYVHLFADEPAEEEGTTS